MEIDFIYVLALILFISALIHGSVGFGFPMIATPLLALITDMQTAILYTLIPTLLVNIVSIASEGGFFQALKRFYPLAILAMIGSAIGTQILIYSNSDIFKVILVFAIIVYLLFDYKKIEISSIRKYPKSSMSIFGIGSGIIGGLTNVMSATLIVYVLESKFTKKEIIQSFNICFLFGKIIQIILFSTASVFTIKEFSQSLFPLLFVALALFLGIKLKKMIKPETYKKIVKVILLIIALTLFIQTI